MDRLAKGTRMAGGLLLLANLAAFFLPVTRIEQENYPTIEISPFEYVKQCFGGTQSTIFQMTVILCLMLLPVILSLVAAVIGVIGNAKQLVSGILAVIIAGLYVVMAVRVDQIRPLSELQDCYRAYALLIHLGVSIVAAILGVISFFVRPRIRRAGTEAMIPQFHEIRQENEMARYRIVEPAEKQQEQSSNAIPEPQPQPEQAEIPAYNPSEPRGVMVGLTGVYAGAEIPLPPEEAIRIGRLPDNDLVFADQPRVSRNHCSITWKAAERRYEIIEYSSNGSYINGKDECLPQNMTVYLQPGTILDIGSEENRFRME